MTFPRHDKFDRASKLIDDEHRRDENYKQRMTREQWKTILLAGLDEGYLVCKGRIRNLQARDLGYGVVEVSKVPLEDEE